MGLIRYHHGIDNEARRALAAAEPPLLGYRLGRRDRRDRRTRVHDAPRAQVHRGGASPTMEGTMM